MTNTTPGSDTMGANTMGESRGTRRRDFEDMRERGSTGETIDSVMDFARDNGSAIADAIGRTVRENPIPIAMIGAGIAWLAFSARGGRDYDDDTGYEYYGLRSEREGRTGRLRQRAAEAGEELRERASHLGERVGERAGELRHKARDQARRARRSGGRFVKEHPLLIGAAGLMFGAALASALPRTAREDSVFGERAERARQAAKEAALREGRKVQDAAKAAVEKAREAVAEKAPTADDLKRDVERTAKAATGGGSGSSTPGPQTGSS